VRISLNGSDWRFKGYLGEDWVWRNGEKPSTRDVRWWYQGTVPGSVHHDLLKLGQLPDPYVEQNSLLVEWVPERTWIYKKSFTADAAWQGQQVVLHFEGVDYSAQFFLNGVRLGDHRGMYTPAAFDVTGTLKYGEENLLAVVLDRAPDEEPQVSKTEYVKTHKSRMTYWWDFCPRMIHIGIWDDVYLEVTGPVRVTDLYVRPQLTPDFQRADLAVAVELDSQVWSTVEAEVIVRLGDQVVTTERSRHALAPGQTKFDACLTVDNPALWWPNGHGEQPLYEAEVRILSGGAYSHVRQTTFGIRQVEAIANDAPGAGDALKYTLKVNGKKIYVKGWNWVPIDVMYGVERPAKLERLMNLARRANVNLLRVWGGGLIEKEAFYNFCDRYGIMVWQEFILSSSGIANKPSDSREYIDMMVSEAEQIIPRKRNHPSLVIWCGGNELMGYDNKPLSDAEPVLGALHDAVRRLDPDRHWLPTSPSGPASNNDLKWIEKDPEGQHDVHGPWEHQGLTKQYTLYNKATSLFHSEFGAEGMAYLNVINRTIAPERQWPANRENPVYFHRGSWWINEPLVQEVFGGISDVPTLSLASQFLQAEALRYALEANRRRQWRNSGSIPWQFNEPYPNSWCTASVDYYTQPKAAYYAVARAYGPVAVTARFETQAWAGKERFDAELWLANSLGSALGNLTLTARVVDFAGRVVKEEKQSVAAVANGASAVGTFDALLPDVATDLFFLDLTLTGANGELLAENRYPFVKGENLAPMLAAPQTRLTVSQGAGGTVTVTNTGAATALQVRLESVRPLESEGYVYFSANHFALLPGESRTVAVEWSGVPESERRLVIQGWNTEVVTVG
jgi:beta-mannosidase